MGERIFYDGDLCYDIESRCIIMRDQMYDSKELTHRNVEVRISEREFYHLKQYAEKVGWNGP